MSAVAYSLAVLLCGLLAVERKAFLQAALSRPLIAGTLLGTTLGRPLEGASLGAAFELFFMGSVNLGASLPDNDLFGTVGAVACGCALLDAEPLRPEAAMAIAALFGLPMAKLGRSSDRLSEHVNAWAAGHAEHAVSPRGRVRFNLFSLWVPLLATAGVCALGLAVGWALPALSAPAPERLQRALSFVWIAFWIVSAAAALRSIRTPRATPYGMVAAAVGAAAQLARTWAF